MEYMFRIGDKIEIQRSNLVSVVEVTVTDIIVGSDNDSTIRCIVELTFEDGQTISVGFFALCQWVKMAQ